MKNSLKTIACFVHARHRVLLLFSVLTGALLLYFVIGIKMDADLMDVLPADNPSMKVFAETMDNFQSMNALTVVIDSARPDIDSHTGLIELLGKRMEMSSLIRNVNYDVSNVPWDFMLRYFPLYLNDTAIGRLRERLGEEGMDRQIRMNYRTLTSLLSSPADIRMISEDPLDVRSLLKASVSGAGPGGMDVSSGYYFSRDHRKAFLFADPVSSSRNFSFVRQLKTEMNTITDEVLAGYGSPQGVRVEYTGSSAISWEAQDSLRRDMLLSLFVTIILVVLIFRFLYGGSLTLLSMIFMTLFLALLGTLAAAYLFFGGLNLITAVVSAMLIGLGFDYTLHIADRYIMEYEKHGNALSALEIAYMNTGKSVITSAVTTACAFFSIVLTSFRGLHELGLIAGIGILACMVSTIFVMGPLLVWSCGRSLKGKEMQKNAFLEKAVPDFLAGRGRLFLVLIGLVVILSASGLPKLAFVSDISEIGLKNSRAEELQKGLAEMSSDKGSPLIVTYTGGGPFRDVYDALEQQLVQWEKGGAISRFLSLSAIIPPLERQLAVIHKLTEMQSEVKNARHAFLAAMNRYGFNAGDNQMAYIDSFLKALQIKGPLGPEDLPDSVMTRGRMFYDPGHNRYAAYIYPSAGQWSSETIRRIGTDLAGRGAEWRLTGWDILQGDLRKSIIRESVTAALLSFCFILVVLYLHFRKPAVIVLVTLPLIFGLLLTLGIMGLTNTGFNYINISALAMIFGISVDYGVYFMQTSLESGSARDRDLISHAFKNIVVCSLTTMAGFGSLMTTAFRGISSLGLVLMIGISCCLLMSACLVPLSGYFLRGDR